MVSLKVLLSIFICFLVTVVVHAQVNQKCGQTQIPPNIESKIIGGRLAKPYSWPWQIGLCEYGIFGASKRCDIDCGGAIIGNNWIVTAGHCAEGRLNHTRNMRIITGVYDEGKRNESGEVIHKIKSIHLHPLFVDKTVPIYDIALFELTDPIKFDDHTQPICLPSQDSSTIAEPNTAWATGWGVKNNSDPFHLSRLLRQVNVPFMNFKKCEKDYEPDHLEVVENVMICAGRVTKYTCQGDSGGPLVVKNKNGSAWFQYGITSWGNGCALKDQPGIYTRVSTFCGYVELITNGEVKCQKVITCSSFNINNFCFIKN